MPKMLILFLPLLYSMAYADFLREIIRTEKGERYGALQCADARFVNDECEGYLRDADTALTRKKAGKKPKFCLGKDGNKYKPGKGYVDQEACMTYKCVKNKKKLSMSGVPIPSCGATGDTGTTSTTSTTTSNTPGPTPTFKQNWLMTGKKIKTRKPIKSPTHMNCWVKCQSNSKCNFIMWMKKKKICTFFSSTEGGEAKNGYISGPVITMSTSAPSMATSTPPPTECPACPSTPDSSTCPPPQTMPTCPPPAITNPTTPSQSTSNSSAIQGTDDYELLYLGPGTGSFDQSEVLSHLPTPQPWNNCSIPEYPSDIGSGTIGAVINGKITMCGGYRYENYASLCYILQNQEWISDQSMNEARAFAAATTLPNGTWWVTGGFSAYKNPHSSTELYVDGTWMNGPTLPTPLGNHCIVRHKTDIFIFGGQHISGRNDPTKKSYVYRDETFTEVASMKIGRYSHGCVLLGKDIYVVGGSLAPGYHINNVEVYNIDSNSWVYGPDLPDKTSSATMMNYKEKIYMFGGFVPGHHYQKTIYQFENNDWKLVGKMKQLGRYNFPAMFVNEETICGAKSTPSPTPDSSTCPPPPTMPTCPPPPECPSSSSAATLPTTPSQSTEPYTEAVHACLYKHNLEHDSDMSLEECKEKCSSLTYCKSLSYLDTPNKWNTKWCYLKTETKGTQPGDYKEPCEGDYVNNIYLEKKPTTSCPPPPTMPTCPPPPECPSSSPVATLPTTPIQGTGNSSAIQALKARSSSDGDGLNMLRYGPQLAIDGKISNTFHSFFHSFEEQYPWLEIELSSSAKISGVKIINRQDCCGERLHDVEVRVGEMRVPDGTVSKLDINTICGSYKGPGNTGGISDIRCGSPILGKFITVQIIGENQNILQVNELELNPGISSCPPPPICPSTPDILTCPPPTIHHECPVCPSTADSSTISPPPFSPSTTKSSGTPSTPEGFTERTEAANISTIEGCSSDGQMIIVSNTEANIITSPGYPQTKYSDNTFCDWTFQSPPGQKISFTLLELETELGYDVLKLYDGAGGDEEKVPILTTMSGTKIHDAVISSKEEMRVTFTTDISNNMKGFKALISAFNKEDLPQFDWLDEKNINVTFPNGKTEIIRLNLSPNLQYSCVYHGKTENTSLTLSSSNTNSGCRSLTEDVEISITSNYLEGKLGLFSLKNGKIKKIDETVFVSNSLIRGPSQKSTQSSTQSSSQSSTQSSAQSYAQSSTQMSTQGSAQVTLPKRIQIPVNFGFDRGLLIKLARYGHGQDFIKRRIEEVFDHGNLLLQGLSKNMIISLVLTGDIVFVDDILHMHHQDLLKSRQFQVDEQTPLIILVDDDYANHVKGLSFRSGACRSDKEPHGVAMVAWNEHSAFLGDVVYHEMGHMLGGIHDGGKSEHHSGLHLGHSEFNSQNVNEWFTSAGIRCYGKTCSDPPPSPSHGIWVCDDYLSSCQLNCTDTYTPIISHIECINGQWNTTTSHNCVPALPSRTLYLLAGGYNCSECTADSVVMSEKSVELYHPTLGSPSCKSVPPQLPEEGRREHTTFYHDSTIYNCFGLMETHTIINTCISLTNGASSWKSHDIWIRETNTKQYMEKEMFGVSSVVMEDKVIFIGGRSYNSYNWYTHHSPTYAYLPLRQVRLEVYPVPNLSYKGYATCVAKISATSFIITGGYYNNYFRKTVEHYDIEKENSTSLKAMSESRRAHGCISIIEEGKQWIIVTGGRTGEKGGLASTERLDIQANTWEKLGNLKSILWNHGMVNSERGVLVMGGESIHWEPVNTVQRLVNREWHMIDPSLVTPRQQFGNVVEVPAYFFSCQLDFHPGLGCPAPNINTMDRKDQIIIENITTLEDCSIECKKVTKCNFWTWFNQDGGKNSLNCVLQSSYGSTLPDSSAVTGDKKCDLECPAPPSRKNGEWTCSKTTCILSCSAGFISLDTKIECRGGKWQDATNIDCWKKKQPAALAGCSGEYLFEQEYPGGEVVIVRKNETCHGVCEGRGDCKAWTWTNDQECRLQTSEGSNQTKSDSISGLKNACRPLCYLVVEEDDEAETNIHYCEDSTSCKDIIQMERSKFKENDKILVCYETSSGPQCADVPYEDVAKVCSDLPPIVSNSIHNRLRKRRFTRSNYATLSWGR